MARKLTENQKEEIFDALERNGNVISKAARDVGITRTALIYRLKVFGIYHLVKKKNPRFYEKDYPVMKSRHEVIVEEISRVYEQCGRCKKKLAATLGVSERVVRNWISADGVCLKNKRINIQVFTYLWVVEKDLILKALEQCHGNVAAVARVLNMGRRAVRYKLKIYRELGFSK